MTEWFLVQERFRNSYFPVYLVVEIMTHEFKEFAGIPLKESRALFEGSHVKWWIRTSDWKELEKNCFQKVQQDPKLISKLLHIFRNGTVPFLRFVKKLHQRDWSKASNAELWKNYQKYCTDYRSLSVYGEPMALFTKDGLARYLENHLKEKLVQKNLEKKAADYFSTLVSPTVPSFASREETELLQIVLKAHQNGITSVEKELQQHTEKYFWLPYDYESEIWDVNHFRAVVEKLLESPVTESQKQYEKQCNLFKNVKKKQLAIVKEVGLDAHHWALFKALQDCSQAMDFKKEVFTQGHWYKNPLVNEIAKRLHVPFEYTYHLTANEVRDGLLKNKLDLKPVEIRKKRSYVIFENGLHSIHTGPVALEWKRAMQKAEQQSQPKELHGTCACPGSAMGKVRIMLSPKQVGEMQEGEILVAQATTPDFVPAMKKAKAIITNEGGITSHAAIVSRELGVPCIVGTQHATKLLKTGDLIEVHAASGTIKKIEKS